MSEPRQLRVMLVDDGRGLGDALAPQVRSLGHDVGVASGVAARTNGWPSPPDVVLLGLDLAEAEAASLGGVLFAHAGPRTPLVVGLADPEDPDAVLRAGDVGAHLVLRKPVKLAMLAGVLRGFKELLDGHDGSGG